MRPNHRERPDASLLLTPICNPTYEETEELVEVFEGTIGCFIENFTGLLTFCNHLPLKVPAASNITVVLNPRIRQSTVTGNDGVNKIDEENGNNVTSYTVQDDGLLCLDMQKFKL